MIKLANTDTEIQACFSTLSELRPNLVESSFVLQINEMIQGGYQLAYSVDKTGNVVAVAGFRIYTNLFMGKHLYVDDLVTKETARSQGHGEKLIHWLKQLAADQQCNHIHLDSGTHRGHAHKFYFREGFSIASFHFSQPIEK
jgi:GNAT superfamily N-acetyltransferase